VEIQGWSGIPRDTPLFESVFAFQNFPIDESFRRSDSPLRLENIRVIDRSDAPLTLTVIPGRKLSLQIEYYTDRFSSDTITRMMGHLRTLLEAIAASPTEKIARLPWLTDAERHQLLVEWNDTTVDYPLDRGLHRWIEEQVERTPNAIALAFEGREMTYRQLNDRANRLAHYLGELGVGEGAMVGVLAERSLEMALALLAILKAGGAYVPLDPELPPERLAYLLEDSEVPILLTQEKWLATLNFSPTHVFCLDREWKILDRQSTENPAIEVTGDALAYTIYTSGSTGQPKGAMNTHRGIVNRLLWMQDAYGLTADDRVLQKTPFGFDVSVWEFFWPLMTGARLVIARPGEHRDSADLVRTIERERITTLHFVPSMLQIFLEEPDLARCGSLRRVICSGEALPVALEQRFFRRLSCQLHNLYGPTEAAIDVTYYACQPGSSLKTVPIGRPIANTSLYILDRNGQPVPIGVIGELYIGGVGLAKGYLKRTELTKERFIADPFSLEPGARLYKTGDLARYREDGTIEYRGRSDNQVKLRGFRIELGEIESTLQKHPGIRDVVVSVREIHPGDPVLVAYLVRLDSPTDENEPRSFLENILPAYMIPSRFVWLEEMPLTPNGKVDRRALPVPDSGGSDLRGYRPPSTPVEETIAALFGEVLGVERVGSEDSFFTLGGHSLTATQLVSRLRSTFEIDLPLKALFEAPAVTDLARKVEGVKALSSPAAGPIARVSRENRRLKISS
jgi:amino acid adenylation domain-containing protein